MKKKTEINWYTKLETFRVHYFAYINWYDVEQKKNIIKQIEKCCLFKSKNEKKIHKNMCWMAMYVFAPNQINCTNKITQYYFIGQFINKTMLSLFFFLSLQIIFGAIAPAKMIIPAFFQLDNNSRAFMPEKNRTEKINHTKNWCDLAHTQKT